MKKTIKSILREINCTKKEIKKDPIIILPLILIGIIILAALFLLSRCIFLLIYNYPEVYIFAHLTYVVLRLLKQPIVHGFKKLEEWSENE